jgi:hypothetical protein
MEGKLGDLVDALAADHLKRRLQADLKSSH